MLESCIICPVVVCILVSMELLRAPHGLDLKGPQYPQHCILKSWDPEVIIFKDPTSIEQCFNACDSSVSMAVYNNRDLTLYV